MKVDQAAVNIDAGDSLVLTLRDSSILKDGDVADGKFSDIFFFRTLLNASCR